MYELVFSDNGFSFVTLIIKLSPHQHLHSHILTTLNSFKLLSSSASMSDVTLPKSKYRKHLQLKKKRVLTFKLPHHSSVNGLSELRVGRFGPSDVGFQVGNFHFVETFWVYIRVTVIFPQCSDLYSLVILLLCSFIFTFSSTSQHCILVFLQLSPL